MIDGVGCPKAVDLLKKFEKKINCKMKLKIIYEKFKEKKLPVPQGYCKMIAVVDKEYSKITLEDCLEIELLVTQYLDLPQPPSEVNDSQSTEIVWYVSVEAIDSLKSKALEYKEDLCLKSFVSLQVDDFIVFSIRKSSISLSKVCALLVYTCIS